MLYNTTSARYQSYLNGISDKSRDPHAFFASTATPSHIVTVRDDLSARLRTVHPQLNLALRELTHMQSRRLAKSLTKHRGDFASQIDYIAGSQYVCMMQHGGAMYRVQVSLFADDPYIVHNGVIAGIVVVGVFAMHVPAVAAPYVAHVGAWVYGDGVPNIDIPKRCVVCNARASKLCDGCHFVRYCGSVCQRRHWPEHKRLCRGITIDANTLTID